MGMMRGTTWGRRANPCRMYVFALPCDPLFRPCGPHSIRHAPHLQYAIWEEQQKDFRRARSVWERGLDVNYRSVTFWLKVRGARGVIGFTGSSCVFNLSMLPQTSSQD